MITHSLQILKKLIIGQNIYLFCFSLPKIYLKFTLLKLCQQFSRLSFTDLCISLRKFTQFSLSKVSLVSLDRLFVYIHRFCVGIDRFLGHAPSSNNPAPDWCTVHDFMKKRFKKSYISFQNFVLNCKCAVTLNSIRIEGTYKSFERP